MDWPTLAACRDAPDPDIFFPVDRTRAATRAAKAICRPCPVLAECRSWAMAKEAYGVWGGLDEHERARVRRSTRTRRAASDIPGGSRPARTTASATSAITPTQRTP